MAADQQDGKKSTGAGNVIVDTQDMFGIRRNQEVVSGSKTSRR